MHDRLPSGRVWIERTESIVQERRLGIRRGADMKTAIGERLIGTLLESKPGVVAD